MTTLDIYPMESQIKLVCAERGNAADMLLEILHAVQAFNGYIPPSAMQIIADCLNLSRAEVYGVVTFYHDFRQEPPARKVVKLCQSEACQSMGSKQLKADIEVNLAADVAIETIYCLGNCALAPSALVDGQVYGRLDAQMLKSLIGDADA